MLVDAQDQAIAREDLCRFLAACYYEPGPELAEEKLFDRMIQAASRLRPDLAAHARALSESFSAQGPEGLLPDYAHLFLGPPEPLAVPYGSVWLDDEKKVMGDSTFAAMAIYAELEFELDEDFREPPDHIAAELEFLYLAIFRENEARRSADTQLLKKVTDLKRRFLEEHLARWVEPFASAVRSSAQCAFYRELVELTVRFIEMERREGSPS